MTVILLTTTWNIMPTILFKIWKKITPPQISINRALMKVISLPNIYLPYLPNYHADMGGVKSDFKVKSFFGTKIFHANADEDPPKSNTTAGHFSTSRTQLLKIDRVLRPEVFIQLKTGDPLHDLPVEGYIQLLDILSFLFKLVNSQSKQAQQSF